MMHSYDARKMRILFETIPDKNAYTASPKIPVINSNHIHRLYGVRDTTIYWTEMTNFNTSTIAYT